VKVLFLASIHMMLGLYGVAIVIIIAYLMSLHVDKKI